MPRHHHDLSARDRAVVELVAKLSQLTARQIGEVLFADLASETPLDRCLLRLVQRGYLSRLEQRHVGGDGGGSGRYVYQLGRAGWRLLDRPGRFWAHRSVNHHAIELADVYVATRLLERRGVVKIIRFDVEREAWLDVGTIALTPDAYLELGYPASQTKVMYYIELDRGTENLNRLREKCARYWHAYQSWDGDVFPIVIFLAPDDRRRRHIERVIAGGPREAAVLLRAVQGRQAATALLVDQ